MQLETIGTIYSPFSEPRNMPIQPSGARGIKGKVEVKPQYSEGLQDLEGFSHIVLVYFFHLSQGCSLKVKPFLDDNQRGVFATRAPRRPNPIGISVVRLNRREENLLHIENVDIVHGTPLLDIKPYVPDYYALEKVSLGWLEGKACRARELRSDSRFSP